MPFDLKKADPYAWKIKASYAKDGKDVHKFYHEEKSDFSGKKKPEMGGRFKQTIFAGIGKQAR